MLRVDWAVASTCCSLGSPVPCLSCPPSLPCPPTLHCPPWLPSPTDRFCAKQCGHPPAGHPGGTPQPSAAAPVARGSPGQPTTTNRRAAPCAAAAAPQAQASAAAAAGGAASRPAVPAGRAGWPPVRPPHDLIPPAHRGPVHHVALSANVCRQALRRPSASIPVPLVA